MSYERYQPSGFSLLPEVVKNLLIINGIFFLITLVAESKFGINLAEVLGLHWVQSSSFRPYQIITYMFMHGGFSHIFLNMLALWMFGSSIENYWGGKRFLTYYLICGLGAALTHFTVLYLTEIGPTVAKILSFSDQYPEEQIQHTITTYYESLPPVVGASGAVFGLLLAFGMMFPNQLIYVYFFIPVKAKYFVIFYGVIELFGGIANSQADNVAHFAHLGGMLFGFLLIRHWRKKNHYF